MFVTKSSVKQLNMTMNNESADIAYLYFQMQRRVVYS